MRRLFRSLRLFAFFPALAAWTAPSDARADDVADAPRGLYARLLGGVAIGKGLRFNNPYRLETELGSSAQSLSLTASYVDLFAAAAFGDPDGLEHGGALHLSFAIAGVPQSVFVPSYFVARPFGRALLSARLGPAIVMNPDPNVGGEAALGAMFHVTAKIGLASELLGDLFYGAGTPEKRFATYPVLSGQLAIVIEHEVLP